MGLFNFFKKKSNAQNIVTNEKDIEIGAKVFLLNVDNRIDYQTAKKIFIDTAIIAKTSVNFDENDLRKFLSEKYRSINFTKEEISAYYQFLSTYAKTKNPIKVSNSSDDFYDKMFETLLDTGDFIYPKYNTNVDKVDFIANKKKQYTSENNQEGFVALMVFNWLRFVNKENAKLHRQILSLMRNIDDENVNNQDKIILINGVLKNDELDKLLSDSKALNEIFIRVNAYYFLIKRHTQGLLSFYAEHESDIDYFLSRANQDYLPTKHITNVSSLTLQDIDRIFIRDMLNGKILS
jgi:hypothetical protein